MKPNSDYIKYYGAALPYLNKELEKTPNNVDALSLKARIINIQGTILEGLGKYDESFDKYHESLTYIDKALAISPNSIGLITHKGIIFFDQGNYDEL